MMEGVWWGGGTKNQQQPNKLHFTSMLFSSLCFFVFFFYLKFYIFFFIIIIIKPQAAREMTEFGPRIKSDWLPEFAAQKLTFCFALFVESNSKVSEPSATALVTQQNANTISSPPQALTLRTRSQKPVS